MDNTANSAWFTRLVIVTAVVVAALYGCNALVRPVIGRFQRLDRTAKCGSNAHFLVRSCSVYADDYDGHFPLAAGWMDHVGPFTKPEWLHCPEVAQQPGAYGYALNAAVVGRDRNGLAKPATTPVVYDSRCLERSVVDRVESLPKPGRHESRAKGGQSLRGNLVGYADGSARFVPDGQPVAGR